MKITQKQSNKKKYILLAVTLLCIGLVSGGAYLWSRKDANPTAGDTTQPMNDVNYDPPTEEEQAATEDRKDEIIKEEEKEQEQKDTPPPTSDVVITIVRAAQAGANTTEQVGRPLNIRTIIDGANSGTCQVSLTQSGQPAVQKNFPITFDGTSAGCSGADIPAGSFSTGGDWNMSIIVVKDGQQSKGVSKKVTIQK